MIDPDGFSLAKKSEIEESNKDPDSGFLQLYLGNCYSEYYENYYITTVNV